MTYAFVELPPFSRYREDYLSDEEFRQLQLTLLRNPRLGAVIRGTGGLRKLRWSRPERGTGKRSGIRTIYYVFDECAEIWLFTVYGKQVVDDLSPAERATLRRMLLNEKARRLQ